ncbi:hypothetical protein RI129_004360 [Pyrocoelia pectoralis]|uniref:lysozyme n=1 Tax=Pyrocoelia pectoralis TaxID=417401 RepID=A0AAN7VI42_9COLE
MFSIRDLCSAILFSYFINYTFSKDIDTPVTMQCIHCICHATTACNLEQSCREDFCGPFGISREYWKEVNSPTVNRMPSSHPDAFKACASSFYCCFHTVQRYMEKNKKDCNGDGKIDCDDFLAIHTLGPDKCDQELPENYLDRYDYCQSVVTN